MTHIAIQEELDGKGRRVDGKGQRRAVPEVMATRPMTGAFRVKIPQVPWGKPGPMPFLLELFKQTH
jgi:hypothetical protein